MRIFAFITWDYNVELKKKRWLNPEGHIIFPLGVRMKVGGQKLVGTQQMVLEAAVECQAQQVWVVFGTWKVTPQKMVWFLKL